jgi:SiaC family regulatory phosphoprotein
VFRTEPLQEPTISSGLTQGHHDVDGQARCRGGERRLDNVFWYCDKEDDSMQELGEEFGEDLASAKFHLEKMAG